MTRRSIVVALPDAAQRRRMTRMVSAHPMFQVIAQTYDLMSTYSEVEEKRPRVVLIAARLAALPEFEVMRALFSTLDVRWLVINSPEGPKSQFASNGTTRASSDLFSISDDVPEEIILRQLLSLTRMEVTRQPAAKPRDPSKRQFLQETLTEKVASRMRTPPRARIDGAPAHNPTSNTDVIQTILIGASTGGVDALLCILSCFPADCPPTLIVQHTGAGFGESLAGLLDRQCRAKVELAENSMLMRQGVVTVGAGTRRHLVMEDCKRLICGLSEGSPMSGHIPSVDMLFHSAVPMAQNVSAALLTGMGRDGAEGLKALRNAGARTIAQNEATSVVYGMPRAAVASGAAMKVLPIEEIGPALLKSANVAPLTGKDLHR
ncbi:chemotaxis protein CheB [Sagittula sp. NFXS13]|uniref:CheB methylesterase domain-containing protein n=1 Tax=Sagittula sp. NFXS13 TaxID=2819095 RepID=UPI0032E01DE5